MQKKRIYSDALGRLVKMRVSTKALRIIDQKGGLDNYLLFTRPDKLNSDFGMKLRGEIQRALARKPEAEGAAPAAAAAGGLKADAR